MEEKLQIVITAVNAHSEDVEGGRGRCGGGRQSIPRAEGTGEEGVVKGWMTRSFYV